MCSVLALFFDLGGHAGADGAAAFADREAQPLLHRDRRDQLDPHLRVVPRHHHLHPPRPPPPPPHLPPPHTLLATHQPRHPPRPRTPPLLPPSPLLPSPPPPPHLRHRLLVPRNRLQRRAPDHRNVVPGILVLRQQLPHLQLHQVQQLRVVHQVALVQEHHDRRHIHLPRQQNVLPRLRHRPVHR